jgi:divalent metal cation (Fe/Co/Zn/Cd) transporter
MDTSILSQQSARTANVQHGRRLEYLTIGWNLLEAIAAIGAGLVSGSIALVGFGFDSLNETPCSKLQGI